MTKRYFSLIEEMEVCENCAIMREGITLTRFGEDIHICYECIDEVKNK